MRSILRACYKFSPLFIGVISIILLASDLVPGRLNHHTEGVQFLIAIILKIIEYTLGLSDIWVFSLVMLPIFGLAIYELYCIWHKGNKVQISGILSLLFAIATSLLLSNHLPTQLGFYISAPEFDRVLTQQVLSENKYQNVTEIGCFKIVNIRVNISSSDDTKIKSIDFVTRAYYGGWADLISHGFTYILNPSEDSRDENVHIYGKWYIY
jgi:hypothetical protein